MRLKLLVVFSCLFILYLIPANGICQRGCCSHHGGVCGNKCCDGTPLSAKCRKASYTPPMSSTIPEKKIQPSKPKPSPVTSIIPEKKTKPDIIYLKNGKRIETKEAWEEGNLIKCYRFGNNIMAYPKDQVERVEKTEVEKQNIDDTKK